MEKTVLTAREAAEIMRISPTAMYKLIREDKVPHINLGRRKVIPAVRFYKWLDESVTGG